MSAAPKRNPSLGLDSLDAEARSPLPRHADPEIGDEAGHAAAPAAGWRSHGFAKPSQGARPN